MSDLIEKDFDNTDEVNDENDFITLTDDEGNDVHFEIIDEFDFNNASYIVLIPFEDLDDEVVILQVIASQDSDSSEYVSIEDEEILNAVFEEFKNRNADQFDFED